MTTNNKIIAEIKKTARSYISDADIMLFGSRARNEDSKESDFDILIITDQDISPENKTPLRTSIRKDLLISGIRTDILIQSRNEIEKKKRLPGHFIKNIMQEAILL